jgi:hypothetical protein
MLIFIILLAGIPIVLWGLDRGSYRACSNCKTKMRRDARICAACGSDGRTEVRGDGAAGTRFPQPR